MNDKDNTKEQLINELAEARQRITELEESEIERKRVKRALRESERKLLQMIEGNSIPAFVVDKKHTVTHCNKAFEKLTGISASKIIGTTNQWMTFYPEERPVIADLIVDGMAETEIARYYGGKYRKSVLIKGAYEAEDFFPDVGEGGKWLFFTAAPLKDHQGTVVGAIETLQDITKRKRAEEALRESEEKCRAVFETAEDSIFIKDCDLRYTQVNPAMEKLFGLPATELIGKTDEDLFGKEEGAHIRETDSRVLCGEIVEEEPTKHVKGVAQIFHTVKVPLSDSKGEIIGLCGIARNITERKRAEELYRTTTEKSFAGVYIVQDEKFVFANPNAASYAGYTPEEMIGMESLSLIHPEDREIIKKDSVEMLNKQRTTPYEFRIIARDGEIRWIMETLTSIYYEGKPAVLGNSMDITEHKRLEEQLWQAQKMKSLGTLVAGVAHEINNPINLITLNTPLLQKIWHDFQPILKEHADKELDRKYGGLNYEFLRENMEQILSNMDMAANRMVGIVTDLKDFARQSSVTDRKPIQINTVVENAVRLVQTTLMKSGVNLKLNLEDDLPLIEGSFRSVEQIILNLIVNAVEAIDHDHGKIKTVTGFRKRGRQVFISISDNGRGVEPSISDRIFDPFVTDRQAEGGTGLGLSVTYSLVEAHGGEITFRNRKGKDKGTTFTVFFPAIVEEKV